MHLLLLILLVQVRLTPVVVKLNLDCSLVSLVNHVRIHLTAYHLSTLVDPSWSGRLGYRMIIVVCRFELKSMAQLVIVKLGQWQRYSA